MDLNLLEPFGSPVGHTGYFLQELTKLLSQDARIRVVTTRALRSARFDLAAGLYPFIDYRYSRYSILVRLRILASFVFHKLPRADVTLSTSMEELSLVFLLYVRRIRNVSVFALNNYYSCGLVRRTLFRLIARRVEKILVYSEAQKRYWNDIIASEGQREIVVRVPHYSLATEFRGPQPAEPGSQDSTKYDLIFLGKDQGERSLSLFADVVRYAERSGSSLRFGVFGDISSEGTVQLSNLPIETGFGVLSRDEYLRMIGSTQYVYIHRPSSFMYKVSGIAFDVLSLGRRLLCNDCEPFRELREEYPDRVAVFEDEDPRSVLELFERHQMGATTSIVDHEEISQTLRNALVG